MRAHPTAVISESAVLGEGCVIGPFTVIEDGVRVGAGARIASHGFGPDEIRALRTALADVRAGRPIADPGTGGPVSVFAGFVAARSRRGLSPLVQAGR